LVRGLMAGLERHLQRGRERVLAEVLGKRAQVAEQPSKVVEGLAAADAPQALDRRVVLEAVGAALADAVPAAMLGGERHPHLLRPALHDLVEVARHGEEGAEDEQADRDGAHRQGVDQAAAPEAGERLLEEVDARPQQRHACDYNQRPCPSWSASRGARAPARRPSPTSCSPGSAATAASRSRRTPTTRTAARCLPRPGPRSTTTIPTPSTPRCWCRT